ncbi:hypothetical protein DPMN_175511 [Dreissena polymorpha]|uniref:Uncharacterized protein n=1 Tax=Dreissena polymorpha TaxID=45954 RepID=A0A9D4E9H8_DREPO|nr:hypothetical protein DPMN_175511 [Dreissena polymorpha]
MHLLDLLNDGITEKHQPAFIQVIVGPAQIGFGPYGCRVSPCRCRAGPCWFLFIRVSSVWVRVWVRSSAVTVRDNPFRRRLDGVLLPGFGPCGCRVVIGMMAWNTVDAQKIQKAKDRPGT